MTRFRRILKGVFSWETLITAIAIIVCTMAAVGFVNSIQRANAAERARNNTAAAASRRIDLLNGEIAQLSQQLNSSDSGQAALATEIAALQEQVRQLGGKPVVPVATTTARPPVTTPPSTGPPATSPPTTARPPTTPTTARRPGTTSTTKPCLLNLVCIP